MAGLAAERPTLRVANIPLTVTAHDLLRFLESVLGPGSVYAIDIFTDRKNWKPRGFGRVQFASLRHRDLARSLSDRLVLRSQTLALADAHDDIVPRPVRERHRVEGGGLHAGFMVEGDCLCELECWRRLKVWLMPERRRVEFWVWVEEECYKLEVGFDDVVESVGCYLGGGGGGDNKRVNALLLTVHALHLLCGVLGVNLLMWWKFFGIKGGSIYLWVFTMLFPLIWQTDGLLVLWSVLIIIASS